ncbi:MAG TPA: formylglycine-generating enzyme family protein [Planctomycetota bacterium]|nr:formylglycine-generating enzyme family protein [Planctomycetota bacterium]
MSCSSPAPEEAPSAPPPAAVGAAPAAMADTAVAEAAPISAAAVAAAAEAVDPTVAPAVVWLPPAVKVPGSDAASEAEMRPYTETIPGSDVTFEMVPIRGGVFTIGSPETEAGRNKDEGPRREVRVEPFWMGKCEVTWDEYALWGLGSDKHRREVRGIEAAGNDKLADAITQPTPPYSDMSFGMGKGRRPAICMTQLAAKMYCKWLCAKTGRYYRLPTEAEWEYACRAGSTTAYSFGDDASALSEYAWFAANAENKYHEVGLKKPNPWGLCDMHGNVAEWVLDGYKSDGYAEFTGTPAKPPLVAPREIYFRVVRGGSWRDKAPALRSAYRERSGPAWTDQDPQIPQSIWYHTDADFVGFRVIRPLRPPTAAEAAALEIDAIQAANMDDYMRARGFK